MVDLPEAERPVNQMVAPCCLRSSLRSLRVRPACQVMLLYVNSRQQLKLYLVMQIKTHVDIFEDCGNMVWRGWRRGEKMSSCAATNMQRFRNRRLLPLRIPPTDNASTSTSTQATASKDQEPLRCSNGSVRVGASLPLGVAVGDGRGKLLPMWARLHEFM